VTDAARSATRPAEKSAVTEPADRGRLHVADLVVERIATIAADQVRGVIATGSPLHGVLGRRYPKASAQVAGDRATVDVEIAVTWTAGLTSTAIAVRDRVRTQVQELAGVNVDAVNVTIAQVVQQPSTPPPRRAQ